MKKYSIILAGGLGLRMKSVIPKQFLEIYGKPIIVQTIERFFQFDKSINLVVVLPLNQIVSWGKIQKTFLSGKSIISVTGGETRTRSVRAGLGAIKENGLVAIHDAARPFVSIKTIEESFISAKEFGSGVTAIELKDSIRKVNSNGISSARNRGNYRLVQTPQTFRINEIQKAYELIEGDDFTDDASLYEAAGFNVKLVSGSSKNMKITEPEDLLR